MLTGMLTEVKKVSFYLTECARREMKAYLFAKSCRLRSLSRHKHMHDPSHTRDTTRLAPGSTLDSRLPNPVSPIHLCRVRLSEVRPSSLLSLSLSTPCSSKNVEIVVVCSAQERRTWLLRAQLHSRSRALQALAPFNDRSTGCCQAQASFGEITSRRVVLTA
jgi:hypothetical protein